MSRILHASHVFALLVLSVQAASAQTITGTPPFGSFAGGPDVINLANLNSHLVIPIRHKAGRGTNFDFDITYDSAIWYPVGAVGSQHWMPVPNWGFATNSTLGAGLTGWYAYSSTQTFCFTGSQPTGVDQTFSNVTYHDAFGSIHTFPGTEEIKSGTCTPNGDVSTFPSLAFDGSGITAQNTGGAFITSSGGQLSVPLSPTGGSFASTFTDRNGNQVGLNSSGVFTDTLGTTALTASGSNPITLSYTPPTGTLLGAVYTISFKNYTVQTNFNAGIGEYRSTAAVALVDHITLPDASQYTFTYEPTPSVPASGVCTPYAGTTCTTARLASVTLPTGGTISYLYFGFTGCSSGNNGVLPDGSASCLQRTVNPGGVWTYTQVKNTGAASTTTITDPGSNVTTIQFQGAYETQRVVNQGASTVLKTLNTCYNGATSPCTTTAITLPIKRRTVIDQFGSTGPQCKHDYIYDTAGTGLLKEQDDYDYGTGAPGALLRKQLITYASLVNIVSLPQTVTLQDGGGNTQAQTGFCYDEATPSGTPTCGTTGSPTPTSGTPQHVAVTGSRGNTTTIASLVSAGTTLGQKFTYFDTGSVNQATDVNGAVTTYSSTGSSCGNSFPTGISEPLSLSRSMTWNCTGGVQLTDLDENSKTITTAYNNDPSFWRPDSIQDRSGAVTNFCYGAITSGSCVRNTTQIEATLTFNSGASTSDILTTVDNIGRPILTQRRQSPSSTNFDSVATFYNNVGLPFRTTIPYVGTAGQVVNAANVSTVFDALGRPTNVADSLGGFTSYFYNTTTNKQNDVLVTVGPAPTGENTKRRQLEYDALGRLTSVCELTSAAGSATCGQSVGQTGYWTRYTYNVLGNLTSVTQNAQAAAASRQTRSYSYDGLGRLTSETNPESGTTNYFWDSKTVGVCTITSNGDLVISTNASGNSACTTYDALHRPLSVAHNPARASSTPDRFFVYDSATVNGIAMTNAKGRLAQAYTCLSPCTKITDLGFSYTGRGEISDEYQMSPNSGGYYHENLTYWEHGATKQISGLASLPSFNYGLDGEGRINAITPSTGQHPLNSTSYNSASLPTTVNLGSGDNDAFTYDPNTNRMNRYQFNINGQAFVGSPTWNANGSLGSLNITDPFNSADTQNCTYSHDDLGRIASANCGSAASQTFTYDAFGNISKSGSPNSFLPTYTSNPPTNRVVSSSGFTYDADGNVLNDGLLTRTFDADDFLVSGNGTSVTIDALGRAIDSGFQTATFYSPDGLLRVAFKTQLARRAFLQLPGGGFATYDEANGGLIEYNHPDHLGSARLTTTPSRTFAYSKAYAPFGEVYASSLSSGSFFTGQGNFFNLDTYEFPAREYVDQGRWPSPDPAGLAAANLAFPQAWNRYAYVQNNPLSLVDPLGTFTCGSVTQPCPSTSDSGSPGWWLLYYWWYYFGMNGASGGGNINSTGGDSGSGPQVTPPKRPVKYYLQATSDCGNGGDREISYTLMQQAAGPPNPAMNFTVQEHIKVLFGALFNFGAPQSPDRLGNSGYLDYISGAGTRNTQQTFTAWQQGGPQTSVFVRDVNGHDYGTNGVYVQGAQGSQPARIFINGVPTPPGTACVFPNPGGASGRTN